MNHSDFELDEKEVSNQEDLEETEEEKEHNKKWLWLLLLLLLLIFISAGGVYTFSYLGGRAGGTGGNIDGTVDKDKGDDGSKTPATDDNQDDEVNAKDYQIDTGYVAVNFGETNYIRLKKAIPLPDEEGLSQNDNVASFSITNRGTREINYEIVLRKIVDKTTLDSSLLDYTFKENKEVPTIADIKRLNVGRETSLVVNHKLEPNQTRNYDLKIWLDKSVNVSQGSSKKFVGIIEVRITAPQGGAALY